MPIFSLRLPLFQKFTWVGLRRLFPSVAKESAWAMRKQRGGGFMQVEKILRQCVQKHIIAHNLLRQDEARYWVPVHIPVPQGNGEASSTDHSGLQPRNYDCDPTVDPFTYVWKGFLKFFRHELAQICDDDKGLLPDHAIHWEDKQQKFSVVRGNYYRV